MLILIHILVHLKEKHFLCLTILNEPGPTCTCFISGCRSKGKRNAHRSFQRISGSSYSAHIPCQQSKSPHLVFPDGDEHLRAQCSREMGGQLVQIRCFAGLLKDKTSAWTLRIISQDDTTISPSSKSPVMRKILAYPPGNQSRRDAGNKLQVFTLQCIKSFFDALFVQSSILTKRLGDKMSLAAPFKDHSSQPTDVAQGIKVILRSGI